MTPLGRFLLRYLPSWAAGLVLAFAYGFMFVSTFIASTNEQAQIIYIDVRGK